MYWVSLLFLVSTAHSSSATSSRDLSIKLITGTLAGTYLSTDTPPIATVLIIGGSGATDRNGNPNNQLGSNNLKLLAYSLAAHNIASLRFDKRLVGASRFPNLSEADLRIEDYVMDAVRWIDCLAKISPAPLFVLGHSEGALIGKLLALKTSKVDGLIVVGGSSLSADHLIYQQAKKLLSRKQLREFHANLKNLSKGNFVKPIGITARSFFRKSVQPYLISWFQYDPSEVISQLDIPILLLYGSSDMQVNTSHGRMLAKSNRMATLKIIDKMNHVFKETSLKKDEQAESYVEPSLPISTNLVNLILGFVTQNSEH